MDEIKFTVNTRTFYSHKDLDEFLRKRRRCIEFDEIWDLLKGFDICLWIREDTFGCLKKCPFVGDKAAQMLGLFAGKWKKGTSEQREIEMEAKLPIIEKNMDEGIVNAGKLAESGEEIQEIVNFKMLL